VFIHSANQFTPDETSQNAMLAEMKFTHPPSKAAEFDNWLSQNVIPKDKLGGHNPWAYTLEGCNMAATVLNTPKAVKRSVQIIRISTFGIINKR